MIRSHVFARRTQRRSLFLTFALVLVLAWSSAGFAVGSEAAAGTAVKELLKPDGALDLSRGLKGSLDLKGYRMVTGENGEPRFVPESATPLPSSASALGASPSSPSSASSLTGSPSPAQGPEADPSNLYWDDQFRRPEPNDQLYAAAVDGAGNFYIGGDFTGVDNVPANRIAKWDGSRWSALGSGMNGPVRALLVSGNDLYAGGLFTAAGEVSASYVAKWNGSSWSALGAGVNAAVWSLALRGGDLYVGGSFTMAGLTSANRIAKWDGSAWSALGSGMNDSVFAIALSASNLYAAGNFTVAGDVSANRIAKWNGTAWMPLGSGLDGGVRALVINAGSLYAGGDFSRAGETTASRVARWDGTSWTALGGGMDLGVFALSVFGNKLYAGGNFTKADGATAYYCAQWDGTKWTPCSPGYRVMAFAASANDLWMVGDKQFLSWNGTEWNWLGKATAYREDLVVSGNDVYAAGWDGAVSKWDGTRWTGLTPRVGNQIYALALSGSDIYVGGLITTTGVLTAPNIAKWDGTSWTALGGGTKGDVSCLEANGNDLYAGGSFTEVGGVSANRIARWDGTTWTALSSGLDGGVCAMALSGSDVYAGGNFKTAGGVSVNGIARWNGREWSALGDGVNGSVYSIALSGNDLYVGGSFTTAGGVSANNVAKWDGTTWTALGSGVKGLIVAIAANGHNVYAAASPVPGMLANVHQIAAWNGTAWSNLGSGLFEWYGWLSDIAVSGNALFVGGNFWTAGGKYSENFAEWQPRVNVTCVELSATPGARTVGNDPYGFYKPALVTRQGTTLTYSGDLPVSMTLDRAPAIQVKGQRVNSAFTLAPAGIQFGGEGASLRVEFSEDDVAAYPGADYMDFRAVRLSYPADYPATSESLRPVVLSQNTALPVRIENGRQIYAITVPFEGTGAAETVAYGAVPDAAFSTSDLELSCTASLEQLKAGESVTYHLQVTNHGPDAASSVLAVDTLPLHALFQEATATKGVCTPLQSAVAWEVGALESAESASAYITAHLNESGTAVNVALVVAPQTDPDPANNMASTPTQVERAWVSRQDDPFTTNSEDATFQGGWSRFGSNQSSFALPAWTASYDGVYGARIWSDPARFRVAGWITNQSEWLPYAQVGSDRYVRVKYYVWAQGQATTSPMEIPNLRLRAQTRFAVNSMLEILHHSNADPTGNEYTSELRPSSNPARPSLYRVDFDPVDVPYLASNVVLPKNWTPR